MSASRPRPVRAPLPGRALALAAVSLAALGLAACDDEDGGDGGLAPAPVGTVVLEFDHVVGDPADPSSTTPVTFGPMSYVNEAGNPYSVTKMQYIVSDFVLRAASAPARADGHFTHDVPHYRDHADPATRTLTIPDVPVGGYARLDFTFGLDDAHNVFGIDYFSAEFDGMEWPEMLGGGYHYMKLEGRFERAAGDTGSYTTHLGHNRDPVTSAVVDHSVRVSLDLAAAVAGGLVVTEGGTTTITVLADLNQWYQDPITYDFRDHGMIMPVYETQVDLSRNGETVWSIGAVR
jgi:hypothetical protein